jgi:hypothetical protein
MRVVIWENTCAAQYESSLFFNTNAIVHSKIASLPLPTPLRAAVAIAIAGAARDKARSRVPAVRLVPAKHLARVQAQPPTLGLHNTKYMYLVPHFNRFQVRFPRIEERRCLSMLHVEYLLSQRRLILKMPTIEGETST